jgi:hypothetical protein
MTKELELIINLSSVKEAKKLKKQLKKLLK